MVHIIRLTEEEVREACLLYIETETGRGPKDGGTIVHKQAPSRVEFEVQVTPLPQKNR